jgi:hypothetical protein
MVEKSPDPPAGPQRRSILPKLRRGNDSKGRVFVETGASSRGDQEALVSREHHRLSLKNPLATPRSSSSVMVAACVACALSTGPAATAGTVVLLIALLAFSVDYRFGPVG